MKKVFKLTDEKKAPERQVDAIKHEVKKYLTRERNKKVAEGADYWDFDCKIGQTAESAKKIEVADISKSIDAQVANNQIDFYLEILAKPGHKINKSPVKKSPSPKR